MVNKVKGTVVPLEQAVARWFTGIHKNCFGNGPHGNTVTIVEDCIVIVSQGILNKFEKSLILVKDGPKRVKYTRDLLFEETKKHFCETFSTETGLLIMEINYSLDVFEDRSMFVIKMDSPTEQK